MTETLFGLAPTEWQPLALPNGAVVSARNVSPVPATGETIVCLGIEQGDDGPLGAFWGTVTVDELGNVTGVLDGALPCPLRPGDRLEVGS